MELEALVFDSYEYYVWQPAFTGQVNVSDDCPTCNCQWELTYDSAGDITYLTLDHNSGELSIYSESWDSASTDDQNLVANITVNYAGYDTMG